MNLSSSSLFSFILLLYAELQFTLVFVAACSFRCWYDLSYHIEYEKYEKFNGFQHSGRIRIETAELAASNVEVVVLIV